MSLWPSIRRSVMISSLPQMTPISLLRIQLAVFELVHFRKMTKSEIGGKNGPYKVVNKVKNWWSWFYSTGMNIPRQSFGVSSLDASHVSLRKRNLCSRYIIQPVNQQASFLAESISWRFVSWAIRVYDGYPAVNFMMDASISFGFVVKRAYERRVLLEQTWLQEQSQRDAVCPI